MTLKQNANYSPLVLFFIDHIYLHLSLQVTFTVLSDVCKSVPGFEIFKKIFPLNHDHPFKNVMKDKVIPHTEPCINLSNKFGQ